MLSSAALEQKPSFSSSARTFSVAFQYLQPNRGILDHRNEMDGFFSGLFGRHSDAPLSSPFEKELAAQLWRVWLVNNLQLSDPVGQPQLLRHDHVLPQAAPSQWLSKEEVLLFLGLLTISDWAKCWYKDLGISVQWDTRLVSSFCSRASHGLAEALSGLHCGPTAFLDQSHFFSFPFTSDTPPQTRFIPASAKLDAGAPTMWTGSDPSLSIPWLHSTPNYWCHAKNHCRNKMAAVIWFSCLSLAEKSTSLPRTS